MTVKMRSTGLKYYRRDLKPGDEFDCDEKDLSVVKILGAEEISVTHKPEAKSKVEVAQAQQQPESQPQSQSSGKTKRQYNRRDMEAKA